MPRYMIQVSYTRDAIVDLIKNPQDRSAAVSPIIEGMGGRVISFDYSFGDFDGVVVVEVPDNVSMAALSMAISAGGALSAFKTTVLLSMEEAVEAMRRANSIAYHPPAS